MLEEDLLIGWIKVEDQSPVDKGEVIILLDDGTMGFGEIIDCQTYQRMRFNGTGKALEYWDHKPTHWMHKPDLS
ncbi:DUF551 domain-containing protein [Acinetobacter seifertii]|uniref:DUF551 domain-containing protein n=1 Tax=Acinetobacter seifertii TaxID=1530123 RepID=UPI00168B4482|nr:DUF551 domain-containing protein [Acinetobacter seifertii]QNY13275.1 DUF551 domain-containing protein [Acinetobacter seifertii]